MFCVFRPIEYWSRHVQRGGRMGWGDLLGEAHGEAMEQVRPTHSRAALPHGMAGAGLWLLLAFVLFSLWNYHEEHHKVLSRLDSKLAIAAHFVPEILGESFFDDASGPAGISEEQDWENIRNLTRVAEKTGVAYLYTLAYVNGEVFITSSSASKEERDKHEEVRYWTRYMETLDRVEKAIQSEQPLYTSYEDRWGSFRHVYIPNGQTNGVAHIIAADLDQQEVAASLRKHLLRSSLGVALLLIAGIPLFVAYRRGMRAFISAIQKSNQALRASEHRLQSVFDNVDGVPIQGYDRDRRIIFWNAASERLYGYSSDEVLGRKLEETIIPASDRQAVVGAIQRWHDEGIPIPAGEIPLRRKDGSEVWVYSNHVMITNHKGEMEMFCIDVDLTELRRVEQKMASLGAVVENSEDVVVVRNLDLRVVATNQAFARATGHSSPEALIGKTDAEIFGVSPESEPIRSSMKDEMIAQTLPPGETLLREDSVITPEGDRKTRLTKKYPIFDRRGSLIGTGTLSTDITERKRAEDALRESEARYRSLAENYPNGVLFLFDRDLRYVSADGQELARIGLQPTDIVGRTVQEVFPELQDVVVPNCLAVFDGERRYYEVNYRDQDYANTIIPVKDNRGRIEYGFAITHNISEQKRAQERIRQMEKMEAIGNLAGGVAHDFNNQLAGVLGYADVLADRLEDPKLKRFAENICTSARRSSDLVNKLLAFSRKGQFQSRHMDIHEVLEETIGMLQRSIDKRIRISRQFNATPSTVQGDPSQIQNAILNLAINARDAMPDGGELSLRTHTQDLGEEFESCRDFEVQEGTYLCVSVADTGRGIAAEILPHLFEPFFTTKEEGKGTGMGLASVYGTVRQHKGCIDVKSELGKGSTFSVFLPLAHDGPKPQTPPSRVSTELNVERILIVDDEALVRSFCVDVLSAVGIEVLAASDGAQAVALYREKWKSIDLVILDMVMPHMDGRTAFGMLQTINPEVKVLLSSGYSLNEHAQEILEQGATGFIQKPFGHVKLLESIRDAVGMS